MELARRGGRETAEVCRLRWTGACWACVLTRWALDGAAGPQYSRAAALWRAATHSGRLCGSLPQQVYLDKPLGVKFGRGRDGGAYIARTDPKLGNTNSAIEAGDKVVKVSASFGGGEPAGIHVDVMVYSAAGSGGGLGVLYVRGQGFG